MTNKTVKRSVTKLKTPATTIAPSRKRIGTAIGIIIAVITLGITILNKCEQREIKDSYKGSILQEINIARNTLDYTLVQRQQNVRNRTTFPLEHSVHISESFADSLSLKTDLLTLYQSLSSAQKSAEELMFLLSQNNSNPTTLQNRENDIKRAINLADKVGPRVAEHIGKSWVVPPANMSAKDRIKYYETQTTIITSAATDDAVQFK